MGLLDEPGFGAPPKTLEPLRNGKGPGLKAR